MIVYKTTNRLNGKFYVGQDAHNDPSYLGSGLRLRRAISKYGVENFQKETLQVCESKEELDRAEKHWISKLDAITVGYNIAVGGTGGKTTPEPWNKGLTKTTDARVALNGKKTGKALEGKTQTEQTKRKRRESLRKIQHDKTWCKRISKALRGRTVSQETRLKISRTLKENRPAKMVRLRCVTCALEFERKASRETYRNNNKKRGPYCSRSCSTKDQHRQ